MSEEDRDTMNRDNANRDRDGRDHREHRHGRDNFRRDRGGRDRGGNRNFRHNNHSRGGGRIQRPLLTSSLNGAGLCLVALAVLFKGTSITNETVYLGLGTSAFIISALISYFAQRVSSMRFLEKISDLFFFVGAILVLVVGLKLGDVLNYLGM